VLNRFFKLYGYELSTRELKHFSKIMSRKICRRYYKTRLFSNGIKIELMRTDGN